MTEPRQRLWMASSLTLPAMTTLSLPRHKEKILPPRRRAVGEGVLPMLRCRPHVIAHDVEQFSDLDLRLPHVPGERCGERAVAALAVERELAVLGRVDHHHARA